MINYKSWRNCLLVTFLILSIVKTYYSTVVSGENAVSVQTTAADLKALLESRKENITASNPLAYELLEQTINNFNPATDLKLNISELKKALNSIPIRGVNGDLEMAHTLSDVVHFLEHLKLPKISEVHMNHIRIFAKELKKLIPQFQTYLMLTDIFYVAKATQAAYSSKSSLSIMKMMSFNDLIKDFVNNKKYFLQAIPLLVRSLSLKHLLDLSEFSPSEIGDAELYLTESIQSLKEKYKAIEPAEIEMDKLIQVVKMDTDGMFVKLVDSGRFRMLYTAFKTGQKELIHGVKSLFVHGEMFVHSYIAYAKSLVENVTEEV